MAYTPENNPYIPGDPYSYDLKWMVEEVKKAQDVIYYADKAVDAATEQASAALDSAMAAEQSAIDADNARGLAADKADAAALSAEAAAGSAEEAATTVKDLKDTVDQHTTDIAVLDGRVDSFASLPAGSTAGNAELLDIRVAADGTTYNTAGDAVRGQASYLNTILKAADAFVQRYYYRTSESSGWRLDENNGLCYSDASYKLLKYEVVAGSLLKIISDDKFQFQNASNVPSSGISTRIGNTYGVFDDVIEVPNGATYLIISTPVNGSTAEVYRITAKLDDAGKPLSNKNLIGLKAEFLYPVYIPSGSTLTMSTADGHSLNQNDLFLHFYDANKNKLTGEGWKFQPANSLRTISNTFDDAYFVSWQGTPNREVQLEFGNIATGYVPYSFNISEPFVIDKLSDIVTSNEVLNHTFNASYHEGASDFDIKCQEFSELLLGDSINNVEAPTDCESFLFFTDPHLLEGSDWQKRCYEYIAQIQKYYNSTPTSFCLCGGDWIGNSDLPSEACFKLGYIDGFMHSMFDNVHMLVGNHDTNYQGKKDSSSATYTTKLSNQSIANLWYRKQKKSYFTFDGMNTKFYCFDTGIENQALTADDNYGLQQAEWFAELLTNDNSKHIALALHILYNTISGMVIHPLTDKVLTIAEAYNNRSSVVINETTYDYTSATGQVEFALFGHTHADHEFTLHDIPCVITTWVRDGSTPTFDLMLADYDARELKCIRVGNGANRTISLD